MLQMCNKRCLGVGYLEVLIALLIFAIIASQVSVILSREVVFRNEQKVTFEVQLAIHNLAQRARLYKELNLELKNYLTNWQQKLPKTAEAEVSLQENKLHLKITWGINKQFEHIETIVL